MQLQNWWIETCREVTECEHRWETMWVHAASVVCWRGWLGVCWMTIFSRPPSTKLWWGFESPVLRIKWTPLKELSAVTTILYGHWRPYKTLSAPPHTHTHTHTHTQACTHNYLRATLWRLLFTNVKHTWFHDFSPIHDKRVNQQTERSVCLLLQNITAADNKQPLESRSSCSIDGNCSW